MAAGGLLEGLRNQLIVSCQAYPGEPLSDASALARIARAVVEGGASAVRAQGIDEIRAIVAAVDVPVVGLWKTGEAEVYITPTLNHAIQVARAGADVVAIDGTRRPRPDGLTLAETIMRLRGETDALIMADCGSAGDAMEAAAAEVDIIGTTLAGYTGERAKTAGPDLELVAEIAAQTDVPVIAEGRYWSGDEVVAALSAGAFAVCVGTAITHPTSITKRFTDALARARTGNATIAARRTASSSGTGREGY